MRAASSNASKPCRGDGRPVPTFIYETVITPIEAGQLTLAAQGFTSGNNFGGMIVITGQATIPGGPPQYFLVDSDPVTVNVRPLPRDKELPGFNGAIGVFTNDPPKLATNVVRVGDPVALTVTIRGQGNLGRLIAPPPPRVPRLAGVRGHHRQHSAAGRAGSGVCQFHLHTDSHDGVGSRHTSHPIQLLRSPTQRLCGPHDPARAGHG